MKLNFLLFLIGVQFNLINCNPNYAIVAPKTIKPNIPFTILVSFSQITKQTNVTARIEINGETGRSSVEKTECFNIGEIQKSISQQFDFKQDIKELTLIVTSIGEVKINERFSLKYVLKDSLVLVQTDKPIYLPGQDVNFRVLFLNSDLMPLPITDVEGFKIFVIDPNEIKLRFYSLKSTLDKSQKLGIDSLEYTNGVTSDSYFTLHDQAQKGNWKIQVDLHGILHNYTFAVQEYQLPLANLTINLPKFIQMSNPELNYSIDFYYTFGKPVQGSFEMTIKIKDGCVKHPEFNMTIEGSIMGSTNSTGIDLREKHLLFSTCNTVTYDVFLTATDHNTNDTYKIQDTFQVIDQNIKAEFEDKRKKFRPGKKATNLIKVSDLNGKSLNQGEMEKFSCEAIIQIGSATIIIQAIELMRKPGQLMCAFPTQNTYNLITIQVKNSKNMIINQKKLTPIPECTKEYIQISTQDKTIKPSSVGEFIQFTLESNFDFDLFSIFVVAKGDLIHQSIQKSIIKTKTGSFKLQITKDMYPFSTITVFTRSPVSSLIISDSFLLVTDLFFKNNISISNEKFNYEPNETGKMSVSTEANSQVFLLGLDEAILTMSNGNDISTKRVMAELIYMKNNINEGNDVFSNQDTYFKTDYGKECKSDEFYSVKTKNDDEEEIPPINNDDSKKIREMLSETWIWDSFNMTNGRTTSRRKMNVPEAISTYRVTGFSISPKNGLGIVNVPARYQIFKKLFVKLSLPYSIIRTETTPIHFIIFNYFEQDMVVSYYIHSGKTDYNCKDRITLKSNEVKYLSCEITPKKVGKLNITAELHHDNGTIIDGEVKHLVVKYEGHIVSKTETQYFDLTEDNENKKLSSFIEIKYPENRVKGSEILFLSASTEMVSPLWNDRLDKLKEMTKSVHLDFSSPGGCCQQRTVRYFPKVFWLDYMKTMKRDTPQLMQAALKDVEFVISQLCFNKKEPGSFSYFPSGDDSMRKKPFLWQTILSLKVMKLSKKYISLNVLDHINQTEEWIIKQKKALGFKETDPDIEIYNTGTNAYLSSFAILALNRNDQETLTYLAINFPFLKNPLDKISSCYALNYYGHVLNNTCFKSVRSMAKENDDFIYWIGENNQADFHVTAYGLMLLTKRGDYKEAMKVFRFLSKSQNFAGAFLPHMFDPNSYIPLICTEAMTDFAVTMSRYNPDFENIDVIFDSGYKNESDKHIILNNKNEMTQFFEGNSSSRFVNFTVQGMGRVKLNAFWQYNTKDKLDGAFNLNTSQPTNTSLKICSSLKNHINLTNVLVELDFPSGYMFKELKNRDSNVDRIENSNQGTHVNIYLKKRNEYCFTFEVIESFAVKNRLPGLLKMYQYYERSTLKTEELNIDS